MSQVWTKICLKLFHRIEFSAAFFFFSCFLSFSVVKCYNNNMKKHIVMNWVGSEFIESISSTVAGSIATTTTNIINSRYVPHPSPLFRKGEQTF